MSKLKRLFYLLFCFIFLYITVNILFRDVSTIFHINSLIILPIGIIILIAWYIIWKYLLSKFELLNIRIQYFLIFLLFLIIIVFEVLIIKWFDIPLGWDFGYIVQQSADYVHTHLLPINSSIPYYFQHFPNNVFLYVFLIIIFKFADFFGISNLYFFSELVNAFVIFMTVFLTYLYIKKTKSLKYAFFSLIIFLFFLPVFLYIPILYSDTLALIFIPLLLYISTFFQDGKSIKKILSYIFFCLFTFIGCKIKMTVLFISIGIAIGIFFSKKYLKSILLVLIVFISYFCLSFIFDLLFIKNDRLHIKYDDYGKIPYTHWIMMGIDDPSVEQRKNSYGGYSGEDYIFTESFSNSNDAKNANIVEIKSRLKSYGIIGYLNYLTNKAVNCWGDGTYYVPIKMQWANKYNMDSNLRFITGNSDSHIMFYFMSGVQYAFLLVLCFTFIRYLILNKDESLCFLASISMLMLFLLFWENRSRYLLHYVSLFVIIVVYNLNDLLRFKDKE